MPKPTKKRDVLYDHLPTSESDARGDIPRSIPGVETSITVDFEQWLAVDWFYPKDFDFEGLNVENDSLTCVGKNQKIVFQLPLTVGSNIKGSNRSKRIQKLFRLYQLNKHFAPSHLEGLVSIEWMDGEPYWDEQIKFADISKKTLELSSSSEVGLILNEDLSRPNLSQLLASPDNKEILSAISLFAKSMLAFHNLERTSGKAWTGSEMHLLEDITEFVVEDLADFAIKCLPFIDRTQAKMFNEVRYWLNLNLEKALHSISRRFSKGKFSYLHGNIRFSNCFYYPEKEHKIQAQGRFQEIFADPYLDLADLSVELELSKQFALSNTITENYFLADPSLPSEKILLPYFKQLQLLHRYYALIIENHSLEEDDFAETCEQILSLSTAAL